MTEAQQDIYQQLEEEKAEGSQSRDDVKYKLDASIGWGELAYRDNAAAPGIVKDLVGMFENLELSRGPKRVTDEGLELEGQPSKAVVIDGSAARARVVKESLSGRIVESEEELEHRDERTEQGLPENQEAVAGQGRERQEAQMEEKAHEEAEGLLRLPSGRGPELRVSDHNGASVEVRMSLHHWDARRH